MMSFLSLLIRVGDMGPAPVGQLLYFFSTGASLPNLPHEWLLGVLKPKGAMIVYDECVTNTRAQGWETKSHSRSN